MPSEYTHCVDSYVKRGVSPKTAKARCAASYYKRHDMTVKEAHEKGIAFLPETIRDGLDWELSLLVLSDLGEIGATISACEPKGKTEMIGSVLDIVAVNSELIDDFGVVEIIATMTGAHAYTEKGVAVRWTESALVEAQETWKYTRVSINHNKENHGKVLASFMDGKLLRMVVKVGGMLKDWIKKAGNLIGVSIEATDVEVDEKTLDILSAVGCGVTFVLPPHIPACTQEEGCGIVGSTETEKTDVDSDEITTILSSYPWKVPADAEKILRDAYKEAKTLTSDKTHQTNVAWTAVKLSGFDITGDGFTRNTTLEDYSVSNIVTDSTIYYPSTTGGTEWYWVPWLPLTTPYTGGTVSAPYNINEGADSKGSAKEGEQVTDETPKTICAEKHETLMKEKDSVIEGLNKQITSLESVVASYDAEKKASLLDQLKAFVDPKSYEGSDIKTIETVLGAMKAFKEKTEKEPVMDSGAVVKATDGVIDPTGKAMSNTFSEAEITAKADAEVVDATWAAAGRYGYKKPTE